MNAAFGVALAVVANLAWVTAIVTTSAWYSASLSQLTYSVALIGSTILAIGLAAIASLHVASIGHAVSSVDRRIATLRGLARSDTGSAPRALPSDQDIEDELDEVLGAMERDVGGALVELRTEAPGTTVSARPSGGQAVRSVLRELVGERAGLGSSASRVRWAMAGPIVAAVVFSAISAAMLPASEDFSVRDFQANTFLILFLSYGWPILLAWSVAAVAIARHIRPP